MTKSKKTVSIDAQGVPVTVVQYGDQDYISLTDMLKAKGGHCGGIYANKDIAFEFTMWISPEFKIYLIKEFQRLKEEEQRRHAHPWNAHRTLDKVNYRIHTDAIKAVVIPPKVPKSLIAATCASEAGLLNAATQRHGHSTAGYFGSQQHPTDRTL